MTFRLDCALDKTFSLKADVHTLLVAGMLTGRSLACGNWNCSSLAPIVYTTPATSIVVVCINSSSVQVAVKLDCIKYILLYYFNFVMAETTYRIAFKKAVRSISIVLCDKLLEICDDESKMKKRKMWIRDWMIDE